MTYISPRHQRPLNEPGDAHSFQKSGGHAVLASGRAPGLPLLRRARDEGDVRSVLGQGGEYVVHLEYADQGDSASVSRFRPGIILVIFLLDEYFFGI